MTMPPAATRPTIAPLPEELRLRSPVAADAPAIARLIADCPPLDTNSLYCTLVQASQFADTCRLAERDGALLGWVSGHRLPRDPATLFIWQVAISPAARGQGLGVALLRDLLAQPRLAGVNRLQATITPSNGASWALFRALAAAEGGPLVARPHFDAATHFGDAHEAEHLVTIGPLASRRLAA